MINFILGLIIGGLIGMGIMCLFQINRDNELKNRIYKVKEYLRVKQNVPEWWDTDFMICIDILNGGSGDLLEILGGDVDDE